jgi:hypothetical protein
MASGRSLDLVLVVEVTPWEPLEPDEEDECEGEPHFDAEIVNISPRGLHEHPRYENRSCFYCEEDVDSLSTRYVCDGCWLEQHLSDLGLETFIQDYDLDDGSGVLVVEGFVQWWRDYFGEYDEEFHITRSHWL